MVFYNKGNLLDSDIGTNGPYNHRTTQPSLPAGRIRRRFLPAVGLLLLVSILSSITILFNAGNTGSTLQLELGLVGGESLGQSWRFVHATGAALAPSNTTERPTLAETFFTPECAEAWIATGALCNQITHGEISHDMRNALRMSIIHTWVNGSDKRLHTWKEAFVKKARPVFVIAKAPGVAGRHFRDHDELVHSLRSVIHSLREEDLADLHLVTGDLPAGEMRIGQMPTWLDRNKSCSTHLQVHHHWDIFKMRIQNVLEPEAKVWRERILPTFNSIAIESQLVTLAPQLTDTALYFNDDFFLTRRLARSDFSSPLFGPVFRMQNHVRVSSSPKGTSRADPDGEWPSLEYANWLLDQRFGARKRPYMAHFVKTYSTPLLQEVANIWGNELTDSAAVRFRGAGRGTALGLAFFASNYVIERHREALLWSFLVARSDRDSSGTYSTAERRTLLTEIGFIHTQSDSSILVVPEPIRLPNDGVEDALTKAGLDVPLSTRYSFTSHEGGYAYTGLNARPVLRQAESSNVAKKKPLENNGWPHYRPGDNKNNQVACTLNLFDCFGDAFMAREGDMVSVQEVFKRVSFEQPLCGDCIISSLLGASGHNGLSAFLPRPTPSTQSSVRVALSMSKNWRDAEYDTSGGRTRAVSLLRRYSYVLGDSPAELVPISKSDVTQKRLDDILTAIKDPGGPAFVVLNDDMSDRASPKDADAMNRLIWRWMEALWPEKMCWES